MIRVFDYAVRFAVAVILLQTLWFKFRAAPESVAIFTALHAEPWGRVAAGVVELAASVLLFLPRGVIFGAGLAFGTMLCAVLAHLFVIGVAVRGDGGLLFGLAIGVALLSLICIYIHRAAAFVVLRRLKILPERY
ncbi:MAG: DoxX-like family protein [Turneriella sp.]|nr:DoxX-like family protein [Turneriella sp.]